MTDYLDKKKKSTAFKISQQNDEEEENDCGLKIKIKDDEIGLVVKCFFKMYKKRDGFKGRPLQRKEQVKEESSNQPLICVTSTMHRLIPEWATPM